jgi:hypothetical protein
MRRLPVSSSSTRNGSSPGASTASVSSGSSRKASARLAAENRRIEAALTDEELELTQLRETTEADAFREMADAFDTRVEAIRAAQEAKARNLTEQADSAQAQFFERVAPILLDIVRDRGAAVLMDSRAVLAVGRSRRRDRDGHRGDRRALGEGGATRSSRSTSRPRQTDPGEAAP